MLTNVNTMTLGQSKKKICNRLNSWNIKRTYNRYLLSRFTSLLEIPTFDYMLINVNAVCKCIYKRQTSSIDRSIDRYYISSLYLPDDESRMTSFYYPMENQITDDSSIMGWD